MGRPRGVGKGHTLIGRTESIQRVSSTNGSFVEFLVMIWDFRIALQLRPGVAVSFKFYCAIIFGALAIYVGPFIAVGDGRLSRANRVERSG